MLSTRVLLAVELCCLLCCLARGQITEDTTLESYFMADRAHSGFVHVLSWGQTDVRFNDNFKATFSGIASGGNNSYDEACVSYEKNDDVLRLGRIRTAFGFSNWSELFYNGFNHLPLVRIQPLAGSLRLTRNDAGGEVTFGRPALQVQASLIDTSIEPTQVGPKRITHATVRLQTQQGNLILGGDALQSLVDSTGVYGFDVRWTILRLIVRGEFFAGASSSSAWGYYADASYRVPKLIHTQLVARTEGVTTRTVTAGESSWDSYGDGGSGSTYSEASVGNSATYLQTVGIRQVFGPNLAANLNYGWGSGVPGSYVNGNGLRGWTLRVMFQLHF